MAISEFGFRISDFRPPTHESARSIELGLYSGFQALLDDLHNLCTLIMMLCMRTTISLDDKIFEAVKRRAAAEGRSVSAFIAAVLDDAIKRDLRPEMERPFRLVTVGGGGPYSDVDLDRPRELLVAEDEERYS